MSIVDVQNYAMSIPPIWEFNQLLEYPLFDIFGKQNRYYGGAEFTLMDLPTPEYELIPDQHPSYFFALNFWGLAPANENFTIITRVKCYVQQPDNSLQLATTTLHSFIWREGTEVTESGGTNGYREFCTKLSCLDLISGEDECTPLIGIEH